MMKVTSRPEDVSEEDDIRGEFRSSEGTVSIYSTLS